MVKMPVKSIADRGGGDGQPAWSSDVDILDGQYTTVRWKTSDDQIPDNNHDNIAY